MVLRFFSADFLGRWCSWNTFESFAFSYRIVFDCLNTFLAMDWWSFFFVFGVLIESLIDLSFLSRIYIWIKKGIGPKYIFFLSIIFQNNAHLLNFVIFLSVKLKLIVEELLCSSCFFIVRIDLWFESTFSHLILLHLLFQFI